MLVQQRLGWCSQRSHSIFTCVVQSMFSLDLEYYPFFDASLEFASLTTIIESLGERGIRATNSLFVVFETPISEWRARSGKRQMCASLDASANKVLEDL